MAKPVVGERIDSWCAPCKLMLAHTIEAVVGEKITRTHCNTCGAQHAYRAKPPGSKDSKTRRPRPSGSGKTSAEIDYQSLLRGKDIRDARAYAASERFQAKEIIHHPVFGLGLVIGVRDSNKIDVGFMEGLKTLVHNTGV